MQPRPSVWLSCRGKWHRWSPSLSFTPFCMPVPSSCDLPLCWQLVEQPWLAAPPSCRERWRRWSLPPSPSAPQPAPLGLSPSATGYSCGAAFPAPGASTYTQGTALWWKAQSEVSPSIMNRVIFTSLLPQWDFFHGKFGLLSTRKASCNRVTLPCLQCFFFLSLSFFVLFPWSTECWLSIWTGKVFCVVLLHIFVLQQELLQLKI